MIPIETLRGIASEAANGGGGSDNCLVIIPETVSALNGGPPESIS